MPRHTDFIGTEHERSAMTMAACACSAAFFTSIMSAFLTPSVAACPTPTRLSILPSTISPMKTCIFPVPISNAAIVLLSLIWSS